jgi:hypothetical protein
MDQLLMATALVFTGHSFPSCQDTVLPSRLALDLFQYLRSHELDDRFGQVTLDGLDPGVGGL